MGTGAPVNILQNVDYRYNVRGWLKGINNEGGNFGSSNDLFMFSIDYSGLYNGNISATSWKSKGDNTLRSYDYQYDGLNRLTMANYSSMSLTAERYGEGPISYDKNGNILRLQRWGYSDYSGYDKIDDLEYTYKPMSNQLLKVHDNGTQEGFSDSPGNTGDDYFYDLNGNMRADLNKNIGETQGEYITYNHLNLPVEIIVDSSNKIKYVYDASGRKLSKQVITNNQSYGIKTHYGYGFVYENNVLQYFSHPKGYAMSDSNGNFSYVYQYKDHLGSVRMSYSDVDQDGQATTADIRSETHYYPFGMEHKNNLYMSGGSYAAEKYKYNGKELQDELQLNVYDYGWRQYDPAIGRFLKTDRFAEKYHQLTPYGYAANNPIFFVDIQGDSLRVANNQITKDYLNSAVKDKNQQYVKYGDNGDVTLDFGDMNAKDITKTLNRDKGLSALNELITSTDKDGNSENYYFEVSNNREGILNGESFTLSLDHLKGTTTGRNDHRYMLSLSTTDRGEEGVPNIQPANGYDGALYVSPGKLIDIDPFDSRKESPVSTGGFMIHELREMYLRTHGKMSYPDAHKAAGGHPTFTGYKFD